MENLLGSLSDPDRSDLLSALRNLVDSLHEAGFRDRNLDLRNLLARRTSDGAWLVAKIDSPRRVLRRRGHRPDRLVLQDRARLEQDLARHRLPGLW